MIKFQVENISFGLPQSWDELTYKQWQLLKLSDNKIESVLSVLSGIEVKQIKHWGQSFLDQALIYLEWMGKPFKVDAWKVPTNFMGATVPEDIKRFTFGQKVSFERIMSEEYKKTKDLNNVMDKCIAIYMQPLVQRCEFDYDKAIEFANQIGDQKFCEVYPLAGFFLTECRK